MDKRSPYLSLQEKSLNLSNNSIMGRQYLLPYLLLMININVIEILIFSSIIKIMERGLSRRHYEQYEFFLQNLACNSNKGGNVETDTVDISETIVPFSCYFAGVLLTLFMFAIEVCKRKCKSIKIYFK